jgi:hypothetical protein
MGRDMPYAHLGSDPEPEPEAVLCLRHIIEPITWSLSLYGFAVANAVRGQMPNYFAATFCAIIKAAWSRSQVQISAVYRDSLPMMDGRGNYYLRFME